MKGADEYITVTPSPGMRAAVLAAAGLPDLLADRPDGWGALEFAESKAREALRVWDDSSSGLIPPGGSVLAVALRQLLKELEAERQARR